MPERTPRDVLREWLPHALMLALLALSLSLLAKVFAPISQPVLLAAAVAALTYPLLFDPLHRLCRYAPAFIDDSWRRSIAAFAAVTALIAVLVSPLLLLLATAHFEQTTADGTRAERVSALTVGYGVLRRDPYWIDQVAAKAGDRIDDILRIYPKLPLSSGDVRAWVRRSLTESEVGPTFLGYLFHGTGGFIAQLALALTALFYFYDFGPTWTRALMSYTPLDLEQRTLLRQRFRSAVFRVVTDTLGMALAKGLVMGLIAWAIGGFNGIAVAVVTTFVSLLPVIGFTFVWLPLATLLWAQQHRAEAILLTVLALGAAWIVNHAGERLTQRLVHRRSLWLSFLLFLGLVGGLIAFGAAGVLIAPIAVVIAVVLASFWLPLYGLGSEAAAELAEAEEPRA